MRIGIDIQSTTGSPSGLGYYTNNLLSNLKQIDTENEYVLLGNKSFYGNLSTPKRILWEQIILPGQIFKNKIDILHIPGFSPPIIKNCKLVVTLHDLIGVKMPENNLSFFSRFYWGKYLPNTAKTADIIITDSECSKKDIVEILKIPKEKVKVVYLAAGKEFCLIEDDTKIRNVKIKYNIGDCQYILYVGTTEFRKNLISLLNIWEKFNFQYKLVITGPKTKFSENISKVLSEKKLSDKIVITGYVPTNDLVLLYNGARLFVYPSSYEGFGLPVLEAMSCGTPVITSNTSSLPEIVGNAGIMIDPSDLESWGNSIMKLMTDDTLHNEMRKKGLLRAKMFSWEKVAKETLHVYKMV